MNNKLLISVIIPVYNREKFIRNCLEIITDQTYKNLEIIVVNDGSSDDSVNIINTFVDERIKLIHHEKNQGLSAARNTGIDNATGEYIHFMDDDDEVNSEFYEYLITASEKHQADMSVCSLIIQYGLSNSLMYDKEIVVSDTIKKYEISYMMRHGYVWRYLFKTDFLRKNNLKFEIGRFCEDGIFSFMSVFYANKIVSVPKAVYNYTDTPNSITNKTKTNEAHRKKYQEDHEYGQKLMREFAQKHHIDFENLQISKWKYKPKQITYGLKMFFKTFNFGYLKF